MKPVSMNRSGMLMKNLSQLPRMVSQMFPTKANTGTSSMMLFTVAKVFSQPGIGACRRW